MNLRQLTLADIKRIQQEKLQELIQCAGTIKHLSYMLNIPLPTIYGWVERGRISKEGAKFVEQHKTLGEEFKAEDLRPDIAMQK